MPSHYVQLLAYNRLSTLCIPNQNSNHKKYEFVYLHIAPYNDATDARSTKWLVKHSMTNFGTRT